MPISINFFPSFGKITPSLMSPFFTCLASDVPVWLGILIGDNAPTNCSNPDFGYKRFLKCCGVSRYLRIVDNNFESVSNSRPSL